MMGKVAPVGLPLALPALNQPPPQGGGKGGAAALQEKLSGVCGPLPKTLPYL